MKTRLLIIIGVVFCILIVSLPSSYAQYLGNQESYSFVVDDKNQHEIRFSSHVTNFEGIFYDNDAQSIIAHVNSDNQLYDNILFYLHADSFYELFGGSQQTTPSDVLILLDGEEQKYDVLPKAPKNNYVIWEFKNMPNIQEIEIILEPERYRNNQTTQTLEKSFSIIEKQVRYDLFYNMTNGSISNVQLNCNSASFMLSILSDDDGTIQLDIPKGMLGGIFMVLVDDEEWDDVSIDENVLTINFTEGTSTIEVLGSYNLSTNEDDGVCDVIHNPPHSYIVPSLMQFKSGIPMYEIQCKENLILIQKYDGSPACVKSDSFEKLYLRGWGDCAWNCSHPIPENIIEHSRKLAYLDKTMDVHGTDHSVKYRLDGNATVTDSIYSEDIVSVIITLDAITSGSLTIELPRTLIDSGHSNCDPSYEREDSFAVLIDNVEVRFEEIVTTSEKRTLSISFQENTKKIEIVTFCLI